MLADRLIRLRFVAPAVALLLSTAALPAQSPAALPATAHTASGLEFTGPALTLHVDALRDDVLRVRLWPAEHPSEDASWAVLPASRSARVNVTPTLRGFATTKLVVEVGPDNTLSVSDTAGHILQRDAVPVTWTPDGFRVSKVKAPDAHFFGLGDKPGPLDRAGQAFALWNTDSFGWQESTDPIYKSIPFFLEMHGGRTTGVLFDNTFRTFFDFGRERADRYTFSAPAGPLDYYILYGPEPKQVVEEYAWLTGPTPLPPLWALGYQQSRYSYFPQSQVEDIAAHLRRDRIPTDVLWLDIDYQLKNRPFTVDPERFPDFPGLIHKLTADHFRTIVITDLHVADLPNAGYAPYDTGKAGDHFVKENGQDYVGKVWPGDSVFPDFTRAITRQWWGTNFKQFMSYGIAGFWNDMNEPAVFRYPSKTMPDDVEHRIAGNEAQGFAPRTAMHPEIHNVYGMENSRATEEGMLTIAPNLRPFVMTRASYAGGQRYAVTWTGDNSSTWNHLRQTTPQLLNLGLSGFSLAGADVGGFAGSPSPDLLTRWLQLAAFQPIDRDHAAKGTRPHEPWVDGPEHEDIRRRYIEERYRLLPYLYTAAEETSRDGVPILRPLFLEFPHATADGAPLDLQAGGEFFFGPSILVAASPSPEEVNPYEVHLPPGVWYDYWTGGVLDRRESVAARDLEIREADATRKLQPLMVNPKLGDLPVYVEAGAIVPMQPLVQSTAETPQGPLTLRVFPPAAPLAGETAAECAGDLYADDGLTFNFRKGEFLRQHFTCSNGADGLILNVPARQGHFRPWWTALRIEVAGPAPAAAKVLVNGKPTSAALERTSLGWAFTVPDTGRAQTITVR